MSAINLRGRPIAITGASAGIGRATALACAAAGMPVAVAARRTDRLDELVAQIRASGGQGIAVKVDVTCPEECRNLIDATVSAFGSIYAVYANAGYGYERAMHETPDEEIREIFETNFWGSLNVIRPALVHMLAKREGHILMCSSCLAKLGLPYMCSYSATKAAQDHFGRGMRLELAPHGIHVSTVHPIRTTTELFDEVARRSGGSRIYAKGSGFFVQTPERVADATVRCLRRPRGEVWTSMLVRLGLAATVAFPGLTDRVLARIKADPQRQAST
ncbi:MAG: SDR family NAD(P)-dependent oxidoreductase [Phycisphaerales bacterium]|nr:SDR family NAD(P)-dependent oxidoreductase [Phycisphaerales bacterium]